MRLELPEKTRYLAACVVPREVTADLLMGKTRLVGLPEGCQVVRAAYDHLRDGFVLVFEHDSFPAVRRGEEVQVLINIEIERVRNDAS